MLCCTSAQSKPASPTPASLGVPGGAYHSSRSYELRTLRFGREVALTVPPWLFSAESDTRVKYGGAQHWAAWPPPAVPGRDLGTPPASARTLRDL